jgi:hypothetical protein
MTHVKDATNLPLGSVALGYIKTADNGSSSFYVDPPTKPFAGPGTDYSLAEKNYWIRFWIKAARNATTLQSDGAIPGADTGYFHKIGGFWVWMFGFIHNVSGGICLCQNVDLENDGTRTLLGFQSTSGGYSHIAWDTWAELTIHLKLGETDGVYELFINGVLAVNYLNIDTTNISEGAGFPMLYPRNYTQRFYLPAINGITWQITGPIESWSETDIYTAIAGGNIRPRFELETSPNIIKTFIPAMVNHPHGGGFSATGSGTGAGIATYVDRGTIGIQTKRSQITFSGTASGIWTLTSYDKIGALSYNEFGWATIALVELYLPSGASITVDLLDNSNTNSIFSIGVSGGHLTQNGSNLAPINQANRFALLLHLSSSGQATYSLCDLTQTLPNQIFWSGPLANWISQSLGSIKITLTMGSANCQVGSIYCCKWIDIFGHDSIVHADVNGLTPTLASVNHVAMYAPQGTDVELIPGGAYMQKSGGAEKNILACIVARSGRTRDDFTNYVLPYMGYTRGIRFVSIDLGSINDITEGYANNPTTYVATFKTQLSQQMDTLIPLGNKVLVCTMIRREQGTFVEAQLQTINDLNNYTRDLANNSRYSPMLEIADISAFVGKHISLFTAGDNIHFNDAGDRLIASYTATIMSSLVQPSPYPSRGPKIIKL